MSIVHGRAMIKKIWGGQKYRVAMQNDVPLTNYEMHAEISTCCEQAEKNRQ